MSLGMSLFSFDFGGCGMSEVPRPPLCLPVLLPVLQLVQLRLPMLRATSLTFAAAGVLAVGIAYNLRGAHQGDFISLGWWEREDLAAVVDHLRRPDSTVSSIALWGRSMGAVTALLHGGRDPSIGCEQHRCATPPLTPRHPSARYA